ncbi:MAG TPA: glycerophosphodiester phosphodiesterase family protein [Candidatus Hydrogenedentes bacterium]|nr:glycerophosphodiester phosphodiesterase family protein [Candidatus Hydrogenedentota bacterium]
MMGERGLKMRFGYLMCAGIVPFLSLSSVVGADETRTYPTPPRNGGIYVIAHRGAHQGIPENTLEAYQKAIDLGCDFVEIDVRTTKDGKFVSIHNATIDAYVKNMMGRVEDLTLVELRSLDIGSRVGDRWKGTQIPTFEEILALCKGKIGIYLDLKDAPVSELMPIVKRFGMESEIIWYAGSRSLEEVIRLSKTSISMPDPGAERALPRLIERFHPTIIAATWRNYSPSFVKTCHDVGSLVIVDESDPSCWEDAVAWGSDGIQTDHPERLIAYLQQLDR